MLRALNVLAGDGGVVQAGMLPAGIAVRPSGIARNEPVRADDGVHSLKLMQDERIAHAIRQCNGNVSGAAEMLGIHRSTLYRRFAAMQKQKLE